MAVMLSELARREMGRIVVRGEPVRLRWVFEDLISGDGHGLSCSFACSARALASAAEVRMLEEVFFQGKLSLRAEGVVEHFRPALRAAAAASAGMRPAAEQVNGAGAQHALVEPLKKAAERVAFSCGLEVLGPFEVTVESQTLERQRLDAMQRQLAEQRAAGQVEHLQRAGELLKQFESARAASPSLSPGDLLKQLNPADQGQLLQTLLLAEAKEKKTSAVWVVAGPNLVKVDPYASGGSAKVMALPATLGPLRSVQRGEDAATLLVGARSGVLKMSVDSPQEAVAYNDAGVTSQMGFSRAVVWNGQVWACHAEAGLVGWEMGVAERPKFEMRPTGLGIAGVAAARNLGVLDEGRMIFSSQDQLVVVMMENGAPTARAVGGRLGSEVVAVLPEKKRVFVVLKDGVVQMRDGETMEVIRQDRLGGETCAAALLPWLGSARLLLASEAGPVVCAGTDDEVVTHYLSPYRSLRVVTAAHDVIAALSADRQRMIWWQVWAGRQPAGDVFLTAVARHRGADVEV